MKQFIEIAAKEWPDLLRKLHWVNNYSTALFTNELGAIRKHPEYLWYTRDLVEDIEEKRKYYIAPTGIYLELRFKEYYKIIAIDLIAASADAIYHLNMQNIEDSTDYYQFLGYPKDR